MREKLRKQRLSITMKITALMLMVWVIVSVAFATIALNTEKQIQLTEESNSYDAMLDRMTSMNNTTYNELFKYVEIAKTHSDDIARKKLVPKITCGADGTFDKNLEIVLFIYPSNENSKKQLLMDTDKNLYLYFNALLGEEHYSGSGIVNYDDFVASFTQSQLDTIIEKLHVKKDENGDYYALMCKQTYYDHTNGHMYPKTVELVKTNDTNTWYEEDEVIQSFSLTPKNTKGLTLHTLAGDARCIIDGQFVCNDFSSGGLIEDPFLSIDYTKYDPEVGIVEQTGPFTYRYTNGGTFTINTLGFEASDREIAYIMAESYYTGYSGTTLYNEDAINDTEAFENPIKYLEKDMGIRYVKHIDVLRCCADTLVVGISILFVFFLIIGTIITVMMNKVIKTQLVEEEKHNEVTNALAHDIKTPLFIISGYAQNLKEDVNTDKREHYCNKIIERTDEVNRLVHKMLDFAKLGTFEQDLNIEKIDIEDMANEIIEDYYSIPDSKDIRLTIESGCVVNADKNLIKRAISYLLDNAVKYSPEHSDIDVVVKNSSICISNKSENISKYDLKHLTDPYFRVEKNRSSKGNGLGLSIVKSICNVHNFRLLISLDDDIITFEIQFQQ